MVATTDGFKIAEQDLEMRGPGDMYGTKQSGVLKFKLADIVQDGAILEETRIAAQALIAKDATLSLPEHQPLKYMLVQQGKEKHWGKISWWGYLGKQYLAKLAVMPKLYKLFLSSVPSFKDLKLKYSVGISLTSYL